jgi:hypothetical protein
MKDTFIEGRLHHSAGLGPAYVLLIIVAHSDGFHSCYFFKRRQNVLAKCLDEAELPPSCLMEVDFGEPHLGHTPQARRYVVPDRVAKRSMSLSLVRCGTLSNDGRVIAIAGCRNNSEWEFVASMAAPSQEQANPD